MTVKLKRSYKEAVASFPFSLFIGFVGSKRDGEMTREQLQTSSGGGAAGGKVNEPGGGASGYFSLALDTISRLVLHLNMSLKAGDGNRSHTRLKGFTPVRWSFTLMSIKSQLVKQLSPILCCCYKLSSTSRFPMVNFCINYMLEEKEEKGNKKNFRLMETPENHNFTH